MPNRGDVRDWLEQWQGLGRYTFTRADVKQEFGEWPNARRILNRLQSENRVVLARSGFYVIVPPEYRRQGAPPASWFVDDLMDYLGQPYYVGLLSAAAIHGASHHAPQKFQVVTDRHVRDIEAARVRIEFIQNAQLGQTPTQDQQTETGYMTISTPEGTALDLVRYSDRAGGMGNVTTVVAEIAEILDTRMLVEELRTGKIVVPLPYVQRLGYLLTQAGQESASAPLARYVEDEGPRWTPLLAGDSVTRGERVEPWRVTVQEPVVPES